MSIKRAVGGNRLGSGGRMDVNLRTFERSTHDLSKIWRNTQGPGTLIPFMKLVALPGDTFDIDLSAHVMTLPTVGPLFGSFKLQLDVFKVPFRLYIAELHNNMLNIGMNMSGVKIPQIVLYGVSDTKNLGGLPVGQRENPALRNINPSSLLSYLGINGLGTSYDNDDDIITRNFNAIPLLGYWDIYKNYYANTQESTGRFIANDDYKESITLRPFPLINIDDMRKKLLSHVNYGTPVFINSMDKTPYGHILESIAVQADLRPRSQYPLHGIGVKTYQSDIFNNWIETSVVDAINSKARVNTSGGSFTIDTLNLTKKIYDLLNRVAVSGGTYQDWLEVVYTNEYISRSEIPTYEGGLSQEINFQTVVSNSATTDEPLGTLAGRGILDNNRKGGKLIIKCDEPCYIMGIVSITPRLDYSQGNDWDNYSLKTIDDLHKPNLDGIGWQDLITEQMAAWSTSVNKSATNVESIEYRQSAGKQPAWINYMTNYNTCHGNFAINNNQMFMTLNRNYGGEEHSSNITNLTTYIQPDKFNYAFAQTDTKAMNFWVQIAMDITARRKMSAKQIPAL